MHRGQSWSVGFGETGLLQSSSRRLSLPESLEPLRDPNVVRILLDAGADPSLRDDRGDIAFDYMKENEALVGTDVYWRLNDLRFD